MSTCRFDLKGLTSSEMVDFVCQMLHVNKIPKKLVEIMETSNKGNPLRCEQLMKNMVYSKTILVVPTTNLIQMDLTPSQQSLINVAPIGMKPLLFSFTRIRVFRKIRVAGGWGL